MKGRRRTALSVTCANCGQGFEQWYGRPRKWCEACRERILAPSLRKPRHKPLYTDPTGIPEMAIGEISKGEVEDLRKQLRWGGYGEMAKIGEGRLFLKAVREEAERRFYFFVKFIFGARDVTEHLHRRVCDWLQDVGPPHSVEDRPWGGRRKLLMLPVVHLKTTLGSHAFPLWALIQPAAKNLLFPTMRGADLRILLHGETVPKAEENLSIITQHMETNRLLRYLWKDVFWDDPKKEAKEHGGLWTAGMVTVRRSRIFAEPTITAIGVGTGLEQRHYDIIIMDDIATFDAALSEVVMSKAKMRRKALRSRLNDLTKSIELGIGTHWTSSDVYVDWKKDPSVAVMLRSAIEEGKPIWPERYPLEALLALQEEEGMGKVLFSANYMNHPVNAAFSAMDWGEVRTFEIKNGFIVFEKDGADVTMADRMVAGGKFPSAWWTRRTEYTRGTPLDRLYPPKGRLDDETEDQHEQRQLERLRRKVAAAQEGSREWTILGERLAQQKAIIERRGLPN